MSKKKQGSVEFTSDNAIDFTLINEEGDALEDSLSVEEFDEDRAYSITLNFHPSPSALAEDLRKVADWLDANANERIRAYID